MTSNSLMHLIIERLREIPQNQHYEMVGSYGLVKDFLETLQLHGIKVLNFHSVWYVGRTNAGAKFFPIRIRSNLPPGTFILQPKGGGEEMGKKKRAKKPKTPPGGGY